MDSTSARLVFTRLLTVLYAAAVFPLSVYCWYAPWGNLATALAVVMVIIGLIAVEATLLPQHFAALRIACIVHSALGLLLFFPFLRDELATDSGYPVTMAVFVVLNISLPLLVVIRVWHHIAAMNAGRYIDTVPGVRHPQELGAYGWALLSVALFLIGPLVFIGNVLFVVIVALIVLFGTMLGFIWFVIRGHRPALETARRFRLVHRLAKPMKINHWRIIVVAERDPIDIED